jgi:hypothetical protein
MAICHLYGYLPPLWLYVPSTPQCPLYGLLSHLQQSVLATVLPSVSSTALLYSMALCFLYGFCPLYGPFPPLQPYVSSMTLCPLCGGLGLTKLFDLNTSLKNHRLLNPALVNENFIRNSVLKKFLIFFSK